MKVKVFGTNSEILEIIMLLTIISISNCLQKTTGLSLESPNPFSVMNNYNSKLPVKNFTNDAKNDEISTFQYFKNFISTMINTNNIIESLGISNNSENTNHDLDYNLRSKFNLNHQKILNFNNESVKTAVFEDCSLDNCDSEYGRCVSKNKCQCNYSFINVHGVSKKACDYKLSYQLTAMILEMFLPIGFGHFYCKRYLIGFIKFSVLFLIPLIIYAIMKVYLIDDENLEKLKTNKNNKFLEFFSINNIIKRLITFYFLFIFFVWYLFDIVVFAANKHKDGSGFDLIPIYNY